VIRKFLQKIFKIISYGIFFKIYGRIENSISSSEDERIEVKNINIDKDLKYKIYTVTNGRLYTDRIQDTAIIIDNKIIDEASFQLRHTEESKIYNSNIKNNIVFKKGTPRKLTNLNGSVLSLLTGGGGNSNYWHWLFDVLPRIGLFNKASNIKEIDFFLIPDDIKKFQKETLNALNISESKRLTSKKFRHIKAKKLIVTDHPVVISGDATKDIMNMPIWISKWLKESFIKNNKPNTKNNFKNIYIDRSETNKNYQIQRVIENENEIKNLLIEKGFTSIKLHETNFSDQVQLFNNANCIVGLHGGGFANLAFCKPGTKVVELKSLNAGAPIENLANKNNLNYKSIAVEAKEISHYGSPNQQGSIKIPINNLIKMIEN
jgi:capsular polysaccharide biosynthesis protein